MICRRSLCALKSHKIRFRHCTVCDFYVTYLFYTKSSAFKASQQMSSTAKVTVRQGTVVGGEATLPNGSSYNYFKGIPYAVPPLGDLRFQVPIPLERFSSPEIECTKEGDVSFQKDPMGGLLTGSEDCLFLNIYVPKTKTDSQLPVMVFIHGGGYVFGSGNSDFYTPLYLMQEDVVVVTLNYRLGPLGFLSLPEASIPGNAGLKDQCLALQWVKENIHQFNGNSNNVTLFGESAGAACVHFHVLSNASKHLFHKAILQSGTANMPWAVQRNSKYKAEQLAKLIGCISEDPLEIGKFLKSHPELVDFSKHTLAVLSPEERRRELPLVYRPVVEKESEHAVVTEEPLQSMNKFNSIQIPIMMGYNSAEGITMLANAIKNLDGVDRDLGKYIPTNINLHPHDPKSMELANKIREFYFQGARVDKKTLNNFTDLLSDFFFVIDATAAAEIHSRRQHNSPLFFYRFDYVGALNIYKKIFQLEELNGACHAEELFYIFQAAMAVEPWSDRDKKIVQTITKLWANFAKYSNPTPKEGEPFVDCAWEPVPKVSDDEKFTLNAFIIDEQQRMLNITDADRAEFWRRVYRKYNGAWVSKL